MLSYRRTHCPGVACRNMLLVLAGLLLAACERTDPPVPLQGPTMGTAYTVKYGRLPEGLSVDSVRAIVDQQLALVNASMSTYDADTEISRFNQHTGLDWFAVSPQLTKVVDQARAIHLRSGGAFDASIGPLVEVWGFGSDGFRGSPPPAREIEAARARVGMDQVAIRVDPPALRKRRAHLQLDLSAIAKGHAVDRIAQALEAAGITDYLVEIGGELRTAGRRYDGAVWRVGIEQPLTGNRSVQRAIPMAIDGAVATSGDYRNYFEMDGRRYAHLIDPRTGWPVEGKLASVTVIAADCATADGWATALSVLGPKAGHQLAEAESLAALFIVRGGNGFQERSTSAFDNWLATNAALQGEMTDHD